MRIAFVGKGGSGKTTLSALFSQYVQIDGKPILVFDADLNIHLPQLLGFMAELPAAKHLSHPKVAEMIKTELKGARKDIISLASFRKTTPPSKDSKLIHIQKISRSPIADFAFQKGNMSLFVVGTYSEEDIGASCYHNNLAIVENILSHLVDRDGYVIADMVAGVDAFANTLHAQFDLICLIVEPTKRSVEVYRHYLKLAEEAGTSDGLVVVANKVRNESDKKFIEQHVPKSRLVGFFMDSDYLRRLDQAGYPLEVAKLEKPNIDLLARIKDRLDRMPDSAQKRLEKLRKLHAAYVAQDFIRERFGDLTTQIDETFSFDEK